MRGWCVRVDLTWRGADGLVHILEDAHVLQEWIPNARQPRCDVTWLAPADAAAVAHDVPTCLQCLSGQGNTWLALARLYDAALVPAGSAR